MEPLGSLPSSEKRVLFGRDEQGIDIVMGWFWNFAFR
jgi:hypothetical protein